jgi:hypothetical protein
MSVGARRLAVGTAAAAALLGAAGASGQVVQGAVRIDGTFAMNARITTAVHVRGEHRGEHIQRTWTITPIDCALGPAACPELQLVRRRANGQQLTIVLGRRADGAYRGSGVFFVPLRCRNQIYAHGSRARYRITLRATSSVQIGYVALATALRASYFNGSRRDLTPCPLGPSHDAALYTGRFVPPPAPPT